jgi:Na+-driven multidrug efflux pump
LTSGKKSLHVVSAVGVPTLAAWAIAHRICDFAPIPSTGLIRTTSATVGQNLGADGMWLAPALGWI